MRRSRLGVRADGTARSTWSRSWRDHLADRIAAAQDIWRTRVPVGGCIVTHRELAREGLEAAYLTERLEPRPGDASGLRDDG